MDLTEVAWFCLKLIGKLFSVIVSWISSLSSSSLRSISFLLFASGKPLVVCLRFGLRRNKAELGLRTGFFFSTCLLRIVWGKLSTSLYSAEPSLAASNSGGESSGSECESLSLCSSLSCSGPSLSLSSSATVTLISFFFYFEVLLLPSNF